MHNSFDTSRATTHSRPRVRVHTLTHTRRSIAPPTRSVHVPRDASSVSRATNDADAPTSGPCFPFSRIADHATVKAALLIAAVDPFGVGSCLVYGKRGTAKSILCRSLRSFMPRAADEDADDDARPAAPAPFIHVPLGATDDRVLGSIDLDASIASGVARYQPGLIAQSHLGVLYLDDVNLLDDYALGTTLAAVSEGVVRVEREGLSITSPCQCFTLAAFNPEEGDLREHVVDRFAMVVCTDDVDDALRDAAGRVQAVDAAMAWQDDWRQVMRECMKEERELREHVAIARTTFLPHVRVEETHVRRLVALCRDCGVLGHRADIFAAKIARASAALRHSLQITQEDINVAASLAIFPRATREPPSDALEPPPPPTRRATMTQQDAEPPRDSDDETDESDEDNKEQDEDTGTLEPEIEEPDESQLDTQALMDVFQKAMLRKFSERKAQGGAAGRTRRQAAYNLQRGRYVKPMFPKAGQIKSGRIAIDATLRAAAPYQMQRRRRRVTLRAPEPEPRRVFITKDDVRLKRLSRRSSSLTIFVVDASGSMALNRMSVAKAAVFKLLADSYTKRDQVALIEMAGDDAKVVLPPTKSHLLASRRLTVMPCGGGTPLAHGISLAARVAARAKRVGAASAKINAVRVVLLTDARPTRSLTWSENPRSRIESIENAPTRTALREECLDIALKFNASRVASNALVVDTDSMFVADRFARALADRMGATYYALPKLDDRQFAEFISRSSSL